MSEPLERFPFERLHVLSCHQAETEVRAGGRKTVRVAAVALAQVRVEKPHLLGYERAPLDERKHFSVDGYIGVLEFLMQSQDGLEAEVGERGLPCVSHKSTPRSSSLTSAPR